MFGAFRRVVMMLRPLLMVAILLLLSLNSIRAEPSQGNNLSVSPSSPEMHILEYSLTQGGLTLALLVGGWSYRRDFKALFEVERTKTTEALLALQAAASAMATYAEVMRENNAASREQVRAFLEMSSAVKRCQTLNELVALKERTQ